MTQDELFPETAPPSVPEPKWDGSITLVAEAEVQYGGPCAHCAVRMRRGLPIYKVAPACCIVHMTKPRRASTGAGKWICGSCVARLAPIKEESE